MQYKGEKSLLVSCGQRNTIVGGLLPGFVCFMAKVHSWIVHSTDIGRITSISVHEPVVVCFVGIRIDRADG